MFLPDGLELEDKGSETVPIGICQAEDDGPEFKIQVKVLPIKEYRKIYKRLQSDDGGFRSNNSAQDKADRDYIDKVIAGWSGLTVANWNRIVRDGKTLGGAKVAEMAAKKAEIKFSAEAAFYLHRNTWPQDFGNKVFKAVQEGAEAAEEDEGNSD